nr:hypothetical protein B0A51_16259 [Rachicladosporium sp. CCFEE 5018]OQO27472.1 hypothetical protein B0A51_06556 [Rachicladosporium sp. CCFEE 5018]
MGIPGLTARLSGRGRIVILTYPIEITPSPSEQQTQLPDALIVDGPSLAYYIHKAMLTSASSDSSTGPSPGYRALGARIVELLNEMEKTGMRIEAIYFDGVLPGHKLDTRVSRMKQNVSYLRKAVLGDVREARMPEPPFLVPAMLQALLESKYASLVQVVPAEADDYCALHANRVDAGGLSRPLILTDDSDMFVLDIGRSSGILYLSSLTRLDTLHGFRYTADMYCPGEIASSAGLRDLKQAAYYMMVDKKMTFDAAIAKVFRTGSETYEGYASFCHKIATPPASSDQMSTAVVDHLRRMDPRIAEVAYQALLPSTRADLEVINAFLPMLHEDATRFSVWKVGHDIRNLAYRIMLSQGSGRCVVHEYSRRGEGIGHSVGECTASWQDELSEVLEWLTASILQAPLGTSPAQRWQYVGTVIALHFYTEYYAEPITYERTVTVLTKAEPGDWLDVHVSGMAQAAVYSVRMLKHFLDLHAVQGIIDGDLTRLHSLLVDMPGIAELFERSDTDTVGFWKSSAEELVAMLVPFEEANDDEMEKSDDESEYAGTIGSNPYSLLAR